VRFRSATGRAARSRRCGSAPGRPALADGAPRPDRGERSCRDTHHARAPPVDCRRGLGSKSLLEGRLELVRTTVQPREIRDGLREDTADGTLLVFDCDRGVVLVQAQRVDPTPERRPVRYSDTRKRMPSMASTPASIWRCSSASASPPSPAAQRPGHRHPDVFQAETAAHCGACAPAR
jgi:hypothetical protein